MTDVKRKRRRAAPAGIAPSEPERDILDQYLYEVSTYPLLKGAEEIELAKKIRAGDQDALQELVKRNLRFVISVAKKYQNRGLPLIDLIGEGNVAQAREVHPGTLIDGMRVITSGLKAGELVVVDGLQRVRPGAPVTPIKVETDERGMPLPPAPAQPGAPGAAPAAPASAASAAQS